MSGPTEMLSEFHAAVAHPETDALWTRKTLHHEEYEELSEALQALGMVRSGDAQAGFQLGGRDLSDVTERQALEAIARELADVVYVAFGTAHALAIDLDAALAEVHRANMTKAIDGPRRADGKVLKPPGFVPPDMALAVSGNEEETPVSGPEHVETAHRVFERDGEVVVEPPVAPGIMIYLNRRGFRVKGPEITASEIRALGFPPLVDEYMDIWLEQPNEDVLVSTRPVALRGGERFYTTPKNITAGAAVSGGGDQ